MRSGSKLLFSVVNLEIFVDVVGEPLKGNWEGTEIKTL